MNKRSISQLFSGLFSFLGQVVGRVSWVSPPWMRHLRHQAASKPMHFVAMLFTGLLFLCGLGYAYVWYTHLPAQHYVVGLVTVPKASTITEDQLVLEALTIEFGIKNNGEEGERFMPQSVAPLEAINQPVKAGIEMSPAMPGTWVWQNDHQLMFTPDQDWPAGQTYVIHFDQTVFAKQANLQSHRLTFSTLPFEAKISAFKFYQDPIDASHRQAVATIRFNYPVDTASFETHTAIMFEALKQGGLDLDAQSYRYQVSYDKFKRTAYIKSAYLSLPEVSRYLVLVISPGVKSATETSKTKHELTQSLLIPDKNNYFKVTNVQAAIVRHVEGRPEQVIAIETSLGVKEAVLSRYLHVYLLPQNYPATAGSEAQKDYEWKNPGEVTAQILAQASPLSIQALPSAHPYETLHSFQFHSKTPRYLYLKIDKGVPGLGEIPLTQDYVAVLKVPDYPAEISFLHQGALLALSGEKKLSVVVRGLPAVKFDFARVLPENINQLVTQTQGDFNNPMFINQSFNQQNISQIASEIKSFDASDLSKQQYTALDFEKYRTNDQHLGLFLLQATGWDTEKNIPLETKASRMVLITDLGLVVKDNQDGSHDVFVQSITQGTPQAHVEVAVLGKNGLPLLTDQTNEIGQAHFPSLNSYIDDREPVVYVAKLAQDVSFIPYRLANRQLNYTRYDTGGIYTNNQAQLSLSAFLFSDRGIYRPGDVAHIGLIVKQGYVQPQPPGLILQATVIDPRGQVVLDKQLTLDALGYLSFDVLTQETAPTGQYMINLYIVKDNHPDNFLGSTSIQVAAFQPDRMRIQTHLSQVQAAGWVSPADLRADVSLMNLYGAPATDRRVTGRVLIEPKRIEFASYPDYVFADPSFDPSKPAKVITDLLPEARTNEAGQATFNLNLDRFEQATYQLTFFTEGFEAEGGRSVAAQTTQLVSPLSYLIGYKADGDLTYLRQDTKLPVHYLAVDSSLKQQAVNDLTMEWTQVNPISTLVKKSDGTYQYQTIEQNTVLKQSPFHLRESGQEVQLPSHQIGTFIMTVLNQQHAVLSRLKYTVVGTSQLPLEKNTPLMVKLDKAAYHAGEDIELQITAPYTGTGLITIERDKVYAAQWFKTMTPSTLQKIHLPNDFQGNGYVNVTFVRDWNSTDIFSNPLSYSVAPFEVDHAQQTLHIDLSVPAVAKPGQPFTIDYHSDKPGKIIVFAVDEGILQVGAYHVPDPLGFFFQKRALEVLTQQTVDQILPQFIAARELSAVGGDEVSMKLAAQLNPFKRKAELPVVYWSGIIDTDTTPRQLTYQIPDYYNGTLHVMAVGVSMDAVGATDQKAHIRGDFVINPNIPLFLAPGDEFEVSASVANLVKGSGDHPQIRIDLSSTPGLEGLEQTNQSVLIPEGQERSVHFKMHAKDNLGESSVTITATYENHASARRSTLSVRPASQLLTTVQSGTGQGAEQSVSLDRMLYPDFRHVDAVISSSPLILVAGLQRYLDAFPFGCTEQLTSKAFPLLVMADAPWFAPDAKSITDKIMTTIQLLGQRQMSQGGFSYWPGLGANTGNDFASVYAMHFLTEARAKGYQVPNDLFNAGLRYLSELASANPANLDMARIQAYAIYVLTRNEIVTTNELVHLQLYLQKNQTQRWQDDLISVYLASTYQLLKNTHEANQLIEHYQPDSKHEAMNGFYDNSVSNAQYLYLIARHFPDRLAFMGESLVFKLIDAIQTSELDTLLSSYTSLALNAYAQANPMTLNPDFSISEMRLDGQDKLLTNGDGFFKKASLDELVKAVVFHNPMKQRYFYQLIQTGFDKVTPTTSVQQGIEVAREYRDAHHALIDKVKVGDEIEVHIQVRALADRYINQMYIVDLLPGGFEVIRDSVKTDCTDYADIREDRVIFFGSIGPESKEIVYRMKATNAGRYAVPAVLAQAMYAPSLYGRGIASIMTVLN